ncbi:VOC family protein [Ensifer soli]|uniref:VOC family protein n=1 Tax=Ciceribacter sp. sgz301302 TaxID=3342379 RepID=UPI0035B88E1C
MKPNLVLLYVDDALASAAFYRDLFGIAPRAEYPTFSSFEFEGGLTVGLLAKASLAALPSGDAARSSSELAFMVENDAAVEACYANWKEKGLPMAQELSRFDFGPTFVALDPDGHRLRVCLADD